MTLTEASLEAIKQRIGNRKFICGLCGGTRWHLDGLVFIPLQGNIGVGLVIGGPTLPLAPLTCDICGTVHWVSVIRLLGKEKFNELVTQQRGEKEAVEEAEDILKGKGG